MNRTALLLLFLYLVPAAGRGQQVNFEDGFEDGDFTAGPAWEGEAAHFRVTAEGHGHLLQLDSPDTEDAFLSTPSASVEGYWEIYLRFDGFLPSASNRAEIFLMSDAADLEGPVSGYALQAGQSGDDFFRIVRYDGGVQGAVVLEDTTLVTGNADGYRIRVERSAAGEWGLFVARGYLAEPVSAGGPAVDATHLSATHFGVRVSYTSTRSDRFYFDFKIDPPPFSLETIAARADRLELRFSREVDPSSATAGDFTLTPDPGAAPEVRFPSPETVALDFPDSLASERYRLRLGEIRDRDGQAAESDSLYSFIIYGRASPGELLLNEFAWDPPGEAPEFVEVINAGPQVLNLAGWRLGDSAGDTPLAVDTLSLFAGGRLALTSDSAALASAYPGHGPIHPVSSLAALNNSGDALRLISPGGWTADSLSYSPDWGGSDGSLERRSLRLAARFRENWGPAPGSPPGSPGRANAVAPDTLPPVVDSFRMLSSRRAELLFSERLDSVGVDPAHVAAGPGTSVSGLRFYPPDTLRLELSPPLRSNSDYTFSAKGLCDLFGNCSARWDTTFRWQVIETAREGELFLNEFAYDPPAGWSEYVELYNGSGKTFSASRLTVEDDRGKPVPLSDEPLLLLPGAFLVIAPDSALGDSFPGIPLLSLGSAFPALNNAGDRIVIRNEEGGAVDSLRYGSGWGGTEAALERRSLDHPAHARWNWTKAPGGGSPGAKNRAGPDAEAPRLAELRISSPLVLNLIFTEELAEGPAGKAGNYRLEGGPAITAAAFRRPDTVLLDLAAPLLHKRSYTLRWTGLADHFGNPSRGDTAFTYLDYPPARAGDLLINEFMYDPPADWGEFVELVNRSAREVELQGTQVADAAGNFSVLTDSSLRVGPGGFLVLAPDSRLRALFPDIPLLALGSRFPVLNNGGDAIVVRDREGITGDSLFYSPSWGGMKASLERRSAVLPAAVPHNWSESPPESPGSPGRANRAAPDRTPPRLLAMDVLAGSRLELLFSERLDTLAVRREGRFTLKPDGGISRLRFPAADRLLLILQPPLAHLRRYTLSWKGVSDPWHNSAPGDTVFTHIDYPHPAGDDLLVSEFMYDPPDGWTEYVELYNASGREISVAGISLSDSGGRGGALPDSVRVLGAGEYLVLAPDETLQELYPGITLASLGSRFPALNNGGDRIVIRGREGDVLDSLRYRRDWGGEERALERRSFSHPPTFGENWAESDGPGTPGRANGAGPDITPPELLKAEASVGDAVSLLFSERLDERSVSRERFRITPGRSIGEVLAAGDSLVLRLNESLESGTEYLLSAEGLRDLFGNLMEPAWRTLLYIIISPAERGDLVISEFLHLPEEGRSSEFVEVLNRSDKNVELAGWSLEDPVSSARIRESLVLRAGRRVVLTSTASPEGYYPGAVRLPSFPSLNNDADRIALRDGSGRAIDSLSYGGTGWTAKNGHSMERKDPFSASGDPANWEPSRSPAGHTAGAPNSVEGPDRDPPRMLFARLREGALEVDFNEFVRPDSLTAFRAGRLPLVIARYRPERANRLNLRLPGDEDFRPAAGRLTLTAKNLGDYRGNRAPRAEVPVSFPPLPGDLVINEIMYRPIALPGDNLPDQSEYVELWNTSGHALSLEGLRLRGERDENGRAAPLLPARSRHRQVAAGAPALLHADTARSFSGSRTARYFRLEEAGGVSLLRFDRLTMGLGEDGALLLADSSGTVIDSVRYAPEWHNPALADNRGIALEKIDPALPGHRPQSWSSSAAPLGGTPLGENSIYAGSPNNGEMEGLTLAPDPFSPDGDGHEDHLLIAYRLDRPDYLIRVRIYDRYGRLVRTLADGRRAGPGGSLVWDGLSDDRRSNRIGIYIVTLEAYNAASGARQAFRKTAVLARRLKSPRPIPR